jgi:hypothetical protein
MAKVMDHQKYLNSMKMKTVDQLRFIIDDCVASIDTLPDGENVGYYQDEIWYCRAELKSRKTGIQSKVKDELVALQSYLVSMRCALDKAENGSAVEDMYFLEKLEKAANRMGYDLVKKK